MKRQITSAATYESGSKALASLASALNSSRHSIEPVYVAYHENMRHVCRVIVEARSDKHLRWTDTGRSNTATARGKPPNRHVQLRHVCSH